MKHTAMTLAASLLLAATLASCCAQKPAAEKKEMGIQLYSMRDAFFHCDGNYRPILDSLAAWGYTSVELFGYGDGKVLGYPCDEFKANAEETGLKIISSHVGHDLTAEEKANHDFTAALEWWKQCIADHKAMGCRYLVTAGVGVPATIDELQTICDYFNEIGKLCAAEGMQYGYHNHSHEFRRVEGQVMYDYMIQHTDPANVFFEMDVYWAVVGGAAPCEYFRTYPGRFSVLHIKDLCTLGESGMVGFDAIFNATDVSGMKDYVVEVECDPYPSVKNSAIYLQNAPFVK